MAKALKTFTAAVYMLLWITTWMLLLNYSNILLGYAGVHIVVNFVFGFWTWGSMWAVNHQSFHRLKLKELPKLNQHGLREHMEHHHHPNEREHMFVPRAVWFRLLLLTALLSAMFALLQLPSAQTGAGPTMAFIGCWWGMLSFMELYRKVHDRAHTDPHAYARWWFPRSHVINHHQHPQHHPGLYPIFEVLLPALELYAFILRTIRYWEDWRTART